MVLCNTIGDQDVEPCNFFFHLINNSLLHYMGHLVIKMWGELSSDGGPSGEAGEGPNCTYFLSFS